MSEERYQAFSGYGIEIEYMIVDSETLNVKPIADQLLAQAGGAEDMDVPRGAAAWSNELALHVIEIKTAGPTPDLVQATGVLREQVKDIEALLEPLGATLLPSGMHPWMDPSRETHLWPHQNNVIYQTFDRIFDCSGHGWSNLQSTHINFPFADDEQFARVHAACRFVLPLLPALAASSPFIEGKRAEHLDARLAAYRKNCVRVPSVTGKVVPERVFSKEAYEKLLQGIYRDLLPYDAEGTLAEEWVNARGAIARFDRGAVEIRLLDTQECPEQDLAVVALTTTLVRALAEGTFLPQAELEAFGEDELASILKDAILQGETADARPHGYAEAFGSRAQTLGELTSDLLQLIPEGSPHRKGLQVIVDEGPLARRLLRRNEKGQDLVSIYRELEGCLREGLLFRNESSVRL